MTEIEKQLSDIGFGEVVGEYKGVSLKFKALNTEDALVFFSLFMQGDTSKFFTTHKETLIKYISYSTGNSQKWVSERAGSPGFVLFCVNKMLEASDYDYFIINSLEIQDKMMALVNQLPSAKKAEVEQKIAEIEQQSVEAGSRELFQPSVSEQGEVMDQSSETVRSKKRSSSTKASPKKKRKR